MVLIGVIMLLVPGIPFTNAHGISCWVISSQARSGWWRPVLLAAMLALGMMAAIWLMGGAA